MSRTATELLIDIENRLISLEKRDINIETLLKLLLSKVNKNQSIESSVPITINKDSFETSSKTSVFENMAADFGIDIGIENNVVPIVSNSEAMVESEVRGTVRNQRGVKAIDNSKASISQYVTKNNLPILLAGVEIFDLNGELVNKTRTNPKGRWLSALAPGEYKVHIQKEYPADSGRGTVDTTYQINVPRSDKPLELEPLTIT